VSAELVARSPFRIDKRERTVQAVRTTVGGALYAAQIDCDPIPRRRRTNFIKMSRLRLNRLGRVLGEDRLLEGGVKSRTVGEFQPEWITGNQRLAERHQAATLPCSLFDIRVHFCKCRRAIHHTGAICASATVREKPAIDQYLLRPAMTPPSTSQIAPVTQDALSDNKKQITSATSSGLPIRPIG
jgi:hypothetical protein